MVKSTTENRMVLPTVLAFLLAFGPMVLVGCKKEDQSQETQQGARSKETETVSTPKPVEPSDQVDTAGPSEKISLRILYAGLLNTDRAKDFINFLSKHFERVETTDYNTLLLLLQETSTGDQSADFDVTIIDHDGLSEAHGPRIRSYSHAAITIGVPGAHISYRLGLKTAYL